MARPQLENGYTPIANEIIEKFATLHLSPNQWQILFCVIRKTYGYKKKVDYIANCQIAEFTQLGKEVVSRAVKELTERNILTKDGRNIGLNKDWETWTKLAEPSIKVSNTANNNKNVKLAILSEELAEPSIKVSSPLVTQNNKYIQNKEPPTPLSNNSCEKILTRSERRQEKYQQQLREQEKQSRAFVPLSEILKRLPIAREHFEESP